MEGKVRVSPWEIKKVQRFEKWIQRQSSQRIWFPFMSKLKEEDAAQLLRMTVVKSCRCWHKKHGWDVEPPDAYVMASMLYEFKWMLKDCIKNRGKWTDFHNSDEDKVKDTDCEAEFYLHRRLSSRDTLLRLSEKHPKAFELLAGRELKRPDPEQPPTHSSRSRIYRARQKIRKTTRSLHESHNGKLII